MLYLQIHPECFWNSNIKQSGIFSKFLICRRPCNKELSVFKVVYYRRVISRSVIMYDLRLAPAASVIQRIIHCQTVSAVLSGTSSTNTAMYLPPSSAASCVSVFGFTPLSSSFSCISDTAKRLISPPPPFQSPRFARYALSDTLKLSRLSYKVAPSENNDTFVLPKLKLISKKSIFIVSQHDKSTLPCRHRFCVKHKLKLCLTVKA